MISGKTLYFSEGGAFKNRSTITVISFSANMLLCMLDTGVTVSPHLPGASIHLGDAGVIPLRLSFFVNFSTSVINRRAGKKRLFHFSVIETLSMHL